MKSLHFENENMLARAIENGLCQLDTPAIVKRFASDGMLISPITSPTNKTLAELKDLGVAIQESLKAPVGHSVNSLAEAFALKLNGVDQTPALAIVVVPDSTQTLNLAASLFRLGCDNFGLTIAANDVGLLRIIQPSVHVIMRALDREDGLRIYAPAANPNVWIELGYMHPVDALIKAPVNQSLLISTSQWLSVETPVWHDMRANFELAVSSDPIEVSTPLTKRVVELRLVPGQYAQPSMWVVRDATSVDQLLAYLPETVVGQLTFASFDSSIVRGTRRGIAIRVKQGRHAIPDLDIPGAEEYTILSGMSDVYVPVRSRVEPPVRRERLRIAFGINQGEIIWLSKTDDGFNVEAIAESAFVPLLDFVDYVTTDHIKPYDNWLKSNIYGFVPFTSTGVEWKDNQVNAPIDDEPAERKRKGGKPKQQATQQPEPIKQAPKPIVASVQAPEPKVLVNDKIPIDEELVRLEAAFVALDTAADDQARLNLLKQLGRIYFRQGRTKDAGLCLARVAWSSEDMVEELNHWLKLELKGKDALSVLAKAMAKAAPDLDDVRIVALIAACGVDTGHNVKRWLNTYDADLDTRTLWLAQIGLANSAGGDALSLAHTRDRILSRLAGGLPVERELPMFLRFAGRSGALGAGNQLEPALENVYQLANKNTKRKKSPVEAPVGQTNAYICFQLAYGFARIGNRVRAEAIMAEAEGALKALNTDPVHAFLISAYVARINQALEGLPFETPTSAAISMQLNALDRVHRYKTDRLREASLILEPLERPDAIGAFSKRQKDSRGPEFTALRSMDDAARVNEIDRLIEVASSGVDAEKERLLGGLLNVLLEFTEAKAIPALNKIASLLPSLPLARQAILFADALVVAGHFGRSDLLQGLLARLSAAIEATQGIDLERVLQHSLRTMRRVGLRQEMIVLLTQAESSLAKAGKKDASTARGRLAIAAGLAFLGDTARALPIFEQARSALNESMTLTQRLEQTRALALAYAQAPLSNALAGITDLTIQFKDITDSFGTNSHYCLSVLHFIESLVLGITSDDLAINDVGRRYIEDDEHLIRQRLHEDMRGVA